MTRKEAARLRLCMICGRPDARLIRLIPDGRNVRACDACLRFDEYWTSFEDREPMPSEAQSTAEEAV